MTLFRFYNTVYDYAFIHVHILLCIFHKYYFYFCVNNLTIQSVNAISSYFIGTYIPMITVSMSPILFNTPHKCIFLKDLFIPIYVSLHSNLFLRKNMFMKHTPIHMYEYVCVQAIKSKDGHGSK